jgi:(1->4)-alpha-D-glucan 1-alpha-D-glucosylmutase
LAGLSAAWRTVAYPADPALPGLRAALRAAPRSLVDAAAGAFAGEPGNPGSWAPLDALIAEQHWRVARHTLAADAINYRRFFTISDLAGLRVEDPAVFDAVHRLLFDIIAQGDVEGVRIDHIDGLRDPKAYMLRLRDKAPRPVYRFVEKILAADEALRTDWAADGTTGYEVANLLIGLFVNPAAEKDLTDCCAAFTGLARDPAAEARSAKVEIMRGPMAAEVASLARRLHALAEGDRRTRDLGPNALREALIATVAAFDAYRTYADADGITGEDRARVAGAVGRARAAEPSLDPAAFDFLEAVLTLRLGGDAGRELAFRAQQLTGPVMAKGFEDTALYRLPRLIALNEVGGSPGRFGIDIETFHAANVERLTRSPGTLLATSTHDTKRGEDARVRIAAISWAPGLWRERVFMWRAMLEAAGAPAIDAEELYFFFQLLLGAWPAEWGNGSISGRELAAFRGRVVDGMLKSVREAGRNTRWTAGDAGYERSVEQVVAAALDPRSEFQASFRETAVALGQIGMANALAQTALKLTIPGVPDIYQGAEFWEQSLVDPDNRRPVDFEAREAALAAATSGADFVRDGHRLTAADKMTLTTRLLALRKARPELFANGSYEPLRIANPLARRVCAFLRCEGDAVLLVAVAIGWTPAGDLARFTAGELAVTEGWRDPLGPAPAGSAAAPFASSPIFIRARL